MGAGFVQPRALLAQTPVHGTGSAECPFGKETAREVVPVERVGAGVVQLRAVVAPTPVRGTGVECPCVEETVRDEYLCQWSEWVRELFSHGLSWRRRLCMVQV